MANPEHTLEKVVEDLRQRWDKLTPQQRADVHYTVRAFDYPPGTIPPVSEWVSAIPDDPDFEELKKEYIAFEAMRPELLKNHLGRFVAVFHGQVVDNDSDQFKLHDRIRSKYGDQIVLIEQVTEEWPVVGVIETPFDPE